MIILDITNIGILMVIEPYFQRNWLNNSIETIFLTNRDSHQMIILHIPNTGILMVIGGYSLGIACLNGAFLLHANLVSNVLHLPMVFFDSNPVGRMLNRFGKDIDAIDGTLPWALRSFLLCFLSVRRSAIIFFVFLIIFFCIIRNAYFFCIPWSFSCKYLFSVMHNNWICCLVFRFLIVFVVLI